jgi:hypothetical protein
MKWNNWNNLLRNDDPDDLGGGGVSEDNNINDDNSDVRENNSPGQNPDAIAQAIAQGFSSLQQQQGVQQQQQPLSQEEVERRLKVFKPTPELSKKFREALQQEHGTGALQNVLGEMLQGIFAHTNTVAQLIGQKTMMDVDQRYQGIAEHITEQKKQSAKKQFFNKYPSLKSFEQIMPAAVHAAGDLSGKSPQEVDKALASAAEKLIKQFDPNFSLAHAQTGGTNPRPASLSTGGSSGGNSSQKPKSSSIWS